MPPNRSVDGLTTCPEKLICPPNGQADAEKPTSDMPVARPVTGSIRATGMLPIDSSTGPPPTTGSAAGIRTLASRWPPQTGTAYGSVSDGSVSHERTARIRGVSGPSVQGRHRVSACENGSDAEY